MVLIDLNTNVIVNDEFTLITDLSKFFSERYDREEEFIAISLTHSVCLYFGANFEPAYIVTISTVQSQMLPATNQRNTFVIQQYFHKSLKVSPERGLVKYIAIPEENFGTRGVTLSAEIDQLQKNMDDRHTIPTQNLPQYGYHKNRKSRLSMKSMGSLKGGNQNQGQLPAVGEKQFLSGESTTMPQPPRVLAVVENFRSTETVWKMSRRKSFMAMFGK
jgi:hypothetical protein